MSLADEFDAIPVDPSVTASAQSAQQPEAKPADNGLSAQFDAIHPQQSAQPSASDVLVQSGVKGILDVPEGAMRMTRYNGPLGAFALAQDLYGDRSKNPLPDLQKWAYDHDIISHADDPQTAGQKIMSRLGEFFTGSLLSGGPKGAISRAATGTASGMAADVASQQTGSPLAGMVAGLAVPAAAGGLGAKISSSQAARQAEMDATMNLNKQRLGVLNNARDNGLAIVPGELSDIDRSNEAGIFLKNIAGKFQSEAGISEYNFNKLHDIADKDLGLDKLGYAPREPLTERVLGNVMEKAYNDGYKPMEQVGRIEIDPQFYKDTASIAESEKQQALSSGAMGDDTLRKFVDKAQTIGLKEGLNGGAPYITSANGNRVIDTPVLMQLIKETRREANADYYAAKSGSTGRDYISLQREAAAKKQYADSLENLMERGAIAKGIPEAGQMMQNYRNARQAMSKANTYGDIVSENGQIDTGAIQKLKDTSHFTGGLKQITDFVREFPKSNKPIEQARSQLNTGGMGFLTSGIAGGITGHAISSATGLPPGIVDPLAVSAGALANQKIRQAVRNSLPSQKVQDWLLPSGKVGKSTLQSMLPDITNAGLSTLPTISNLGKQSQ